MRDRTSVGAAASSKAAAVLLGIALAIGASASGASALAVSRSPRALAKTAQSIASRAPETHTGNPSSVTIAGSLQSEAGCAGDWDPSCAASRLSYSADDDVWQGTFSLPAGSYEYKAAINDSWSENYGQNATPNGSNIPLGLGATTQVKFYYDHKTHWVADNKNKVIATVPGDFQSEIGCSADWDPSCLRSWLQDTDGDGIYTFRTSSIPVGNYECKVAINESWDENYGQGGVPNGPNIPFTVPSCGVEMVFSYSASTHVLTIAPASAPPQPSAVNIPGNFQSELGCPGDWQPDCSTTQLAYDATDGVWQGTHTVPAGTWEYKAALNNSWDVNYGQNATPNGANLQLNLASASPVKFYYSDATHWITSNRNAVIATVPGSFQSELGCPGDWDPSCLKSWLQDPDGDGIYRFTTRAIPPGSYECKVAINESWDENYGQGGVPNGPNIPFTVPSCGAEMVFEYDASTHVLTVAPAGGGGGAGDVQWDGLRHDTFDAYYRNPFGAVPASSQVTLRFRTAHLDVTGIDLRVYTLSTASGTTTGPVDTPLTFLENRIENGVEYDIWTVTILAPVSPSILYYKFRVTDGPDVDWYSDAYSDDHDNLNQGGEGAAADGEPFPAFQITVYDAAFSTPAWLHAANVYQIFPDRFRNGDPANDYCRPGSTTGCPTLYDQTPLLHSTWNEAVWDPRQPGPYQGAWGNQFFGGDLRGVKDKLAYLQALGVDTLYLNPIFKARSNHRYDTDNFLEVDPALGGDAALAELEREAERRGMRIILDGVFNHSSSDSLYFDRYHRYPTDGAAESLSSPWRGWYNFYNDNIPPSGSDYESWFGFDTLPVFKDDNAGVRDFFYRGTGSVTEHWYQRGADGWRFDVASDLSHDWWVEYRPFAKGYKSDGPLVGEIWQDSSQWLAGDQLDSVMNYRFRKNVLGFARAQSNWGDNDNNGSNQILALTPSQFDRALRSVREDYPAEATAAMLNLLGSHDTNRALYVLTAPGDSGLVEAKERLRLAALFQFTYMGAPMVYYGDEGAIDSPALANGANGPEDDPYNRAPYPWADESGDTSVYGPVDAPVLDYHTKLAHMRKQFPVLRTGSFETLLTGDTSPAVTDNATYAFARVSGQQVAVVLLNNGASANSGAVPVSSVLPDGASLTDVLTGATSTVSGGEIAFSLAARSGAVLVRDGAVVDTTAPVGSISAPPVANGWYASAPVTVTLSGSDAGAGVKELRYWVNDGSVVVVPGATASVAVSAEGTTVVSLLVVDYAGNVSSLETLAVNVDLTNPTIACPSPTSVPAGASCQAEIPDVRPNATASDNLTPAAQLALSQSPAPGTMVGVGSHTVTVTVTDLAGRSSSCTTTVTVQDFTAPAVSCPVDVVAQASSATGATVTYDAPVGNDNCGGSVTVACTPASGSFFANGTTIVTCTATDASGNQAACSFAVSVVPQAALGMDTAGVYTAATGVWALRNTNTDGPANLQFVYGPAGAGWTQLAGDWDGDGDNTPGLYDPSTGIFYLRNTSNSGVADLQFVYGPGGLGWLPVMGDWDGDGDDTVGLYDPSTGVFYLRNTNTAGPADAQFVYGPAGAGWTPIAGDWDGDGDVTVGLYAPTTGVFYLRNTNNAGVADLQFLYGAAGLGWLPVVGDYDDSGTDTVGLYDPSTGVFYLRNAHASGPADLQFQYGTTGLRPIVGDWDGM